MKSLMRVERGGYLKHVKVRALEQHEQRERMERTASSPLSLLPGLLLYSKWSRMMHCNASPSPLCTP